MLKKDNSRGARLSLLDLSDILCWGPAPYRGVLHTIRWATQVQGIGSLHESIVSQGNEVGLLEHSGQVNADI